MSEYGCSIGLAQIQEARELSTDAQREIQRHERATWAANVSTPELEPSWKAFINALDSFKSTKEISESELLLLTRYLSSVDALNVIAIVEGQNTKSRIKFLSMLSFFVSNSPQNDHSIHDSAKQLVERLLICYRTSLYPRIYSTDRMSRLYMALKSIEQ